MSGKQLASASAIAGRCMASVMIVEDHWVWASAVEAQLSTVDGIDVVGVATTADDAIRMAADAQPDVALIDLLLGDDSGLRVARVMRARGSEASIAIITTDPSPWAIGEARDLGLQGFVSKDDLMSRERITQVVLDLAAGERVISPSVGGFGPATELPYGLTAQEQEIIRCWAEGMGNPDVAARLCIGEQTIRNKTSAIGRKMNVSGRLRIVAKARAEGLVGPNRARTDAD